jgi:hypothetical protein
MEDPRANRRTAGYLVAQARRRDRRLRPVHVLQPTGAEVLRDGREAPTVTSGVVHIAAAKLING